jgi:hypothetical protein
MVRILSALPCILAVITAAVAQAGVEVSPSPGGITLSDGGRPFLTDGRFTGHADIGLTVQQVSKAGDWTVTPAKAADRLRFAATVDWGDDAFLCRLTPGSRPDIVQLSIGEVQSSLANALFSPSRDAGVSFEGRQVRLQRNGEHWTVTVSDLTSIQVTHDHYRRSGITYYTPLDKSVFKRAPAGWCSWYEMYQDVSEDKIIANTEWLARNLKPLGCEYVQIDDGWQGVGHGNGENRDWFVTDKRFPHGMKWLADRIRADGFKPGIWLCPFGQSDEKLFRDRPDVFVRRPDGTSIGEDLTNPDGTGANQRYNWVGRYLVDPTSAAGQQYLQKLFQMLCLQWGYDYVKIDGQGGMAYTYAQWQKQLANRKMTGDEAYRYGLQAMRNVMGPKRFLLNCGGAWQSVGQCNGIRIGGDVGADWNGMQPAIDCTMRWLFLNNIAFWTDPDAVCVRGSLTEDQARMWVTLVGITGQLLMASDDMTRLPAERVELLKRIYPVADIRPMCLYPLQGRPAVFDLKVARDWGTWDVVALFNWSRATSKSICIGPRDLGLEPGKYVYYDVWAKRLLAAGEAPLALDLPPTSCRVVAVHRLQEHPQLLGTSRHLTQGADDLERVTWTAQGDQKGTLSGVSHVVAGDPYEIRFSAPPGWDVGGEGIQREGRTAVLTLKRDRSGPVSWQVHCIREPVPSEALLPPTEPRLDRGDAGIALSWQPSPGALGYNVYRNAVLVGKVVEPRFTEIPRFGAMTWTYSVAAYNWGGRESERVTVGSIEGIPPKDCWLDEAGPLENSQDYGQLQLRRSVDGNPLRIGGKTYERGLGTHAFSTIIYDVSGYARFTADVGVDAEKGGAGTVGFEVWVDGKKVFDSGVMRGTDPAKHVEISLTGATTLKLFVNDGGDGINCDHADWADARLYAR